jgi:predicted ATPase
MRPPEADAQRVERVAGIPVRTLVGITGGQGVGKTTFGSALLAQLREASGVESTLIAGLGEHLRTLNVPYGKEATARSIAAIYAAHLERELGKPTGIVLLDRCCVDALAYVRALRVTCDAESLLYDRVSRTMAVSLDLVIHLGMDGIFTTSDATHETPALRRAVADHVRNIIDEFGIANLAINAAADDALPRAVSSVLELHDHRMR